MVKNCKIKKTAVLRPDPVLQRRQQDNRLLRKQVKLEQALESDKVKPEEEFIEIRPDIELREDLHYVPCREPGTRYLPPKTKKQLKEIQDRHQQYIDQLNFCKKKRHKMPNLNEEPTKLEVKLASPSADMKTDGKLIPQKASVTPSAIYPPPPAADDLKVRKPKSGTVINVARKKRGRKKRARRRVSAEEAEDVFNQMLKEELATIAETMGGEAGEERAEIAQPPAGDDLTKQFRKRVSQISAATSFKSADWKRPPKKSEEEGGEEEGEEEEEDENQFEDQTVQKFFRDSEEDLLKMHTAAPKPKKGTLENFSYTKIVQPTLKSFYYGIKQGTIHQGDAHFAERARNHQGICVPIAAFCLTLFKHPTRWSQVDIDEILEFGTQLYLDSLTAHHLHGDQKLTISDLQKYCNVIDNNKVRFSVTGPELVGMSRSEDKKVYNLSKALQIYFNRKIRGQAAILETEGLFFLIWRDRHYFLFDGNPRTIDLYANVLDGVATLGNFYNLKAVLTVLLDRTGLENAPFAIYTLEAFKILKSDAVQEKDSKAAIDELDNYRIFSEEKAVLQGSFDLADKCFGFSRNKQSLTMAICALVYSKISPPSCWYKLTVDKIMIIGNQLFLECIRNDDSNRVRLEDLPAIFTIGPYIVEIYIWANQKVDLMWKKQKCQLFKRLEDFFERNSNALLQIDSDQFLAIWKQRGMYHLFDAYSRNAEGFECRTDGVACVAMHTNLISLVNQIQANYQSTQSIFRLHALKICKINRDAENFDLFPKGQTMNDYPIEQFTKIQMLRRGKCKMAVRKDHVTVDKSIKATFLDSIAEEGSVFEVGSTVHSLQMEEMPKMVQKFPSKSMLKKMLEEEVRESDIVYDLNSASLSDTQIEPIALDDIQDDEDEGGFIDLDEFYLTLEESELIQRGEEEGGGAIEEPLIQQMEREEEKMADERAEEEVYYTRPNFTQIGSQSLLSRQSRGENTDFDNFEITYNLLPSILPVQLIRQQQERRIGPKLEHLPEVQVTLSEELAKTTNFIPLPDGSQIVLGTQNLAHFATNDADVEFMAPFVAIMAAAVAKKYSIYTWSKDVVDYVLKCGADLHKSTNVRYDQMYTMEIPRVSLGRTDFAIKVDYVYDTTLKRHVLEMALKKVLEMQRNCCAILATPNYSAAVWYKNHLYYLFDAFANNEVGMGRGASNKGMACLARFVSLESLAARILHNKCKREESDQVQYNRFVMSCCIVKQIVRLDEEEEEEEAQQAEDGIDEEYIVPITKKEQKIKDEERKKPKIGYQKNPDTKMWQIEGSRGCAENGKQNAYGEKQLGEDFFTCLCASLLLLNRPLKKWDEKRIDLVMDRGSEIYTNVDDYCAMSKKYIENVLMESYVFNLVTRPIEFSTYTQQKTLKIGIETMVKRRKLQNFLIQFDKKCVAISFEEKKKEDGQDYWHVFDPTSSPSNPKAAWTRYPNFNSMLKRLKSNGKSFTFYSFEITSIAKAPKSFQIQNRMRNKFRVMKGREDDQMMGISNMAEASFHEDLAWLNIDPVPWAYYLDKSVLERWNWWYEEFSKPAPLYSLFSTLSPRNEKFKHHEQYLGHCVVAIAMTQIYELSDWSVELMDSILIMGSEYFGESVEGIEEKNYEVTVDDLKPKCTVFPYEVQVKFEPVVEGTMFLMRLKQFNLYKALRYFFDDFETRLGIICIEINKTDKRQYAFGKLQASEYFLYDCCTTGAPMFEASGAIPADKRQSQINVDKLMMGCCQDKDQSNGLSYILRTTTLNRLLFAMTLTLRGGDFFIYNVGIGEFKPLPIG